MFQRNLQITKNRTGAARLQIIIPVLSLLITNSPPVLVIKNTGIIKVPKILITPL